jgi:cytoskeletal protein CcmA (bactofilin family)
MADSDNTTVIAAGTQIRGEMTFDHAVCIQGQFEGKINAKGDLRVAQGAVCRAEVHAGNILIEGTVEGNIRADKQVKVSANAKLIGDVVAAGLTTADGATIQGNVVIGADAAKSTIRPASTPERAVAVAAAAPAAG